jgi:hypothetical protein
VGARGREWCGMAKPDCNDGWKKYAHELDAALAVADFAKRERIVLFEVFSQIFGRFRMKTAILSPIVSRAILDLIKCGVLKREPDGRYAFIKDYESWTKNGKPRLSRKEIIYVAQAPFLARSYWEQNGIQEDTMGIQPDTVTVSKEIPNGIQIDTQTGPPLCTPPIQFENGELKQQQQTADGKMPVEIPSSDPEPGFMVRSDEHAATIEHARLAFGDVFAATVTEMGRDIESTLGGRWDCFRAAVDNAKSMTRPIDDVYRYCLRVSMNYGMNGIPPPPVRYEGAPSNGRHEKKKPRTWNDFTPEEKEARINSLPEL